MTKKKTRLAGAQLPIGIDIQWNKKEILNAIDWALENEVDHLLTPEGSLSGYGYRWMDKIEEIQDAIKEIEQKIEGKNIFLHLGTLNKEKEWMGDIHRNEIRHYWGNPQIEDFPIKHDVSPEKLFEVTHKTYTIPNDAAVGRDVDEPLRIFPFPGGGRNAQAVGMLCNDMWGAVEESGVAINELLKGRGVDLILHATNGLKWPKNDIRQEAFDKYHDGFLRMTAFKSLSYVLTVDTCTPWHFDPETDLDKMDAVITSSESGVVDFKGWRTSVPRSGRQLFYCDVDLTLSQFERFGRFDMDLTDTYPFPLGKFNWEGYFTPRMNG